MGKIERQKHVLDARGQILGRLSTRAANLLRGKNKVDFSYNSDLGDFVIIVNAKDIRVTGKKLENKIYYHHTGYPRGLRENKYKNLLNQNPEKILYLSISRMLPKNRLRKNWLKRLKIFKSGENE